MPTFPESPNRVGPNPQINAWLRDLAAQHAQDQAEGLETPYTGMTYSVKKLGSHITVSSDALMEAGLIPDTRPPYVPARVPLRARLRNRIEDWRMRFGSWIAGTDLDHECDY